MRYWRISFSPISLCNVDYTGSCHLHWIRINWTASQLCRQQFICIFHVKLSDTALTQAGSQAGSEISTSLSCTLSLALTSFPQYTCVAPGMIAAYITCKNISSRDQPTEQFRELNTHASGAAIKTCFCLLFNNSDTCICRRHCFVGRTQICWKRKVYS